MTAPLRLLQISDLHLKAGSGATLLGVDTAATLDAVLAQALTEHQPDALIASGDLAHDPESTAVYHRLQQLIGERYAGPVLSLPGNHDVTALLTRALGSEQRLRLGTWSVLAFDTHIDHRPEARLGEAARGELVARIRACDEPYVLLACHHPPLPVGCPWLDKDCIPDGRELLESCAAEPRVRGLVYGHVHQACAASIGHLAVLGTPATCFQFEPRSQTFAIDRSATTGQPGYRWLELDATGRIRSEVRRLRGDPLNIDFSDRS